MIFHEKIFILIMFFRLEYCLLFYNPSITPLTVMENFIDNTNLSRRFKNHLHGVLLSEENLRLGENLYCLLIIIKQFR